MARKTKPNGNPIQKIRLEHHKTLVDFAFECGVTYQAVYLNECGVYSTILPSIEQRLVRYYEEDPSRLAKEYSDFVTRKRYKYGQSHAPYHLPESDLRFSPIELFRRSLDESKLGFVKNICIHPSSLSKVEAGKIEIIPGQIVIALREIQLPVGDIEELQYRQVEFYHAR